MRKVTTLLLGFFLFGTTQAQETKDSIFVPEKTIVKLYYNNDYICFKLANNKNAKEFLDMLPLTLYMEPYNDNTTLASPISWNFETDTVTEPQIVHKGDLFLIPSLKQIRYIYNSYVDTQTILPIGTQIGIKNLFKNTYNGAEVTFIKKE